jgi:hydroxymethylpyrimidine pyrophosphatase-like HAD family hydrolase
MNPAETVIYNRLESHRKIFFHEIKNYSMYIQYHSEKEAKELTLIMAGDFQNIGFVLEEYHQSLVPGSESFNLLTDITSKILMFFSEKEKLELAQMSQKIDEIGLAYCTLQSHLETQQ